MLSIDKLCYQSKLRSRSAEEKFSFAVLTLCVCVCCRCAAVSCAVLLAMGLMTVCRGGVPLRRYLRLLLLPLSFLLLSALAITVQVQPAPLDLFAVRLGGWFFTGSRAALAYALTLSVTALAAVSCLYFLSLTTPVPEILDVLRRLRCPKLVTELMLLIYRFIFVLLETASAIGVSQRCRLGNRDGRTSMRSFGQLGAVLLVRSAKRADALYASMEARCYDGELRVLPESRPPRARALFAVFAFNLALVLFTIWRGGMG